jgi:sporulation protein YlmC with PRC-barrel domain
MMSPKSVDLNETKDLISSDKVIGTNVYDREGKHIGEVEHLVLGKVSGHVAHAVLSFGGFLGIGEDYYPLPWSKLEYDTNLDGFRVDITREQIEGAPHYRRDEDYDWSGEGGRRVYDYYGVTLY